MRLTLQPLVLLIVLVFSSTGYIQQPPTDEQTAAAIKQLWSADAMERKQGKDRLIRIGQPAIPQLISQWKDFWEDIGPRYATGKEEEGEAAMEAARQAVERHDNKDLWNTIAKVQRTNIRARLIEDTADLLGRLKAVETIPLFIDRLLRDDNGSATKVYWTPAMNALAEMGLPAVPALIEAIETAEGRARARPTSVVRSEQGIKWDTELIQTRAAMVLGRIGDVRALAILTSLKFEDPTMRYHVEAAIKGIFEKAK